MPSPTKSQVKVVDLTAATTAAGIATLINDAIQAQEGAGWVSTKQEIRYQNLSGDPKVLAFLHFQQNSIIDQSGASAGKITKQIQHSDLTGAATTETEAFDSQIPARSLVLGCFIDVTTLFSGGSVSACTVKIGDAGDDDRLLTASDVFTGAATGVRIASGAGLTGVASPHFYKTATTINAIFTSTTDNVVNLSAGDLTAEIWYVTN